jgi:hypothetical protein
VLSEWYLVEAQLCALYNACCESRAQYLDADMVDASGWFGVEEVLDRALVTKRMQQLELGVAEIDKHRCHSMLWKVL